MRRLLSIGAVAFGAAALTACGSSSTTAYVAPTGPPVKTFEMSAKNFAFTPDPLTAPAGILQFDLKSTGGLHDLVIEGVPGFQVEVSGGGSKASGKVKLTAGKYNFYCSVPGHRAAGMAGTLTVT